MAKTRCPAIYKNLGLETFGNKKKVTDEILKQCCKNDEWLRQNVEELRYLSPAAVRKSLKLGESLDTDHSYGCDVANDGRVKFSEKTTDTIEIDLTTDEGYEKWVDKNTTTAVHESVTRSDGTTFKRIQLDSEPVEIPATQSEFGSAAIWKNGYNAAWYVGFDKSKDFYLQPKWIKKWKTLDASDAKNRIPAIARGQTFTVPEGSGGKLVQIDIQLEYNGVPTLSSSPLTVQLWETYKGWVNVTKWNNTTKKVEKVYEKKTDFKTRYPNETLPSNWKTYKKKAVYKKDKKGNYVYTDKSKKKKKIDHYKYVESSDGEYVRKRRKIHKPYSNKYRKKHLLLEKDYNPQDKSKGMHSIVFDSELTLNEKGHYAIVLLSPLNNWETCPRWCGWGRNCKKDEGGVYNGGVAFYSTDNGWSWKIYGKAGKEEGITVYKQGKYVPQDYRFKVITEQSPADTGTKYSTDLQEIRFKPIYGNPISKVELNTTDYGTSQSSQNDKVHVWYELSTDGETWTEFPDNKTLLLTRPSKVIFIRALLQTEDETVSTPPYVEKINVNLTMNLPTEMYARSNPYTPEKIGTILGASIWGRVFAPYEADDGVDCKVDIIQSKENSEHLDIVDIELLDEKLNELGVDSSWLNGRDTALSRCTYLTDNPDILDDLKYNYRVYILPHEVGDKMYNLSFAKSSDNLISESLGDFYGDKVITIDESTGDITETNEYTNNYSDNDIGGIRITDEVAYPIIKCQLEPEDSEGHGQLSSFSEWADYTFDYINNELIFKRSTLTDMPSGTLVITYNPVFIKDLTNNEVGVHYDEETGLRSDGLVLDYFKEKFEIGETELESKSITLKVDAVDPIRQVYLYRNDFDEPVSLMENRDYEYDIDTHSLIFDEYLTSFQIGDILEVVYTPRLEDTTISIGYEAVRSSTNKQCYIDDYYIEYKI